MWCTRMTAARLCLSDTLKTGDFFPRKEKGTCTLKWHGDQGGQEAAEPHPRPPGGCSCYSYSSQRVWERAILTSKIWSEILVRVCYKKGWQNQPLVHVLWKIWNGANFNLPKKFVSWCSVAVEMSIHWFICICWFRNIVLGLFICSVKEILRLCLWWSAVKRSVHTSLCKSAWLLWCMHAGPLKYTVMEVKIFNNCFIMEAKDRHMRSFEPLTC